jgi:hypothetical protein
MRKLFFLLIAACSSTGCVSGGAPEHQVTIGLEADAGCEKMGKIKCASWSKPELKTKLKTQAAELGANYVKLSSVVRNGHGYEAHGIALFCR